MKKFILLSLIVFFCPKLFSQVGINTTSPNATLDIEATNVATPLNDDGILIPRIDNFPSSNPTATQDGMMVFVTGNGTPSRGFYYWDNGTTSWVLINGSGTSDSDWFEENTTSPPSSNAADIFTDGNVGIGVNNVLYPLQIETSSAGRTIQILNESTGSSVYGMRNTIDESAASSNGSTYGIFNLITRTNQSNMSGVSNSFQNSVSTNSFGYLFGYQNSFGTSTSTTSYGLMNRFQGVTTTASGMTNLIGNTITTFYGVDNHNIAGAALSGNFYGLYNLLSGSDSGTRYGVYTDFSETGSGDKYGEYITIATTAGGTHYGIYADVQDAAGYAGYFLGRTSLGTATTNRYLMPATDGTAGQVMTTDGAGNVTFQDATGSDDDWAISGGHIDSGTRDVYIGSNGTVNSTMYISGDIVDWDSVLHYLDPSSNSHLFELRVDDGTIADPAINFYNDNDTGFYSPEAGAVGISTNSTDRFRFTQQGQLEFYNTGNSVFLGEEAGNNDDLSGRQNIAIGYRALRANVSGARNIAIGSSAMLLNTGGTTNVAIGDDAMAVSTDGSNNISIGTQTLFRNTIGDNNVAVGSTALRENTTGSFNTAIGYRALYNTIRNNNVAIGYQAGYTNSTGTNNTFIGTAAGQLNTGSRNVFLGNNAGYNETTSDKLYIDVSNTSNPLIYGDFFSRILRSNGELQVGNPAGTGYAFPTVDGTAGQVLTTDGAGQLSFTTIAADTDWTVSGNDQYAANTGNVGIGDTTPDYKLDLEYTGNLDRAFNIDYQNTAGSGIAQGLNITAQSNSTGFVWGANIELINTNSSSESIGLRATNTSGATNKFGIAGRAIGTGSQNIGVSGSATSATTNYGGYFSASVGGASANYGIVAIADNASGTNWAGFFGDTTPGSGNVFVNDNLRVDGQLAIDPTGAGYTLPTADGTNGQVLTTDGAGQLSFTTAATPNTLDNAYDQGGAGAGRTINADNGDVTITGSSGLQINKTATADISQGLFLDTNIDGNFNASIRNEMWGDAGAAAFRTAYAIDNYIRTEINNGNIYGLRNAFVLGNNAGNASTTGNTGVYNSFYSGSNTGYNIGAYNDFRITSVTHYGMRNTNLDTAHGIYYGMHNAFTTTGSGNLHGSYNILSSSGSGNVYGAYNDLDGSGLGNKYGSYIDISSSSGGAHFGIYSDVQKSTGYAGYFIGRTSLGDGITNRYIMPGADGTAGQVIQTDGAGNLSWTSVAGDLTTANNGLTEVGNDVRLGGTLIQNTSITQGVNSFDINLNSTGDFAVQDNGVDAFIVEDSGDVGIGLSNPNYKLDISETGTTELRAVNVTKTDNYVGSTYGIYTSKTAAGAGRSHAIYNEATSTGAGNNYTIYNLTNGSGTGQKYGVFNEINSTATGNQYGTRNWIRGATTAGQFGTFNNLDNASTGDQYGVYNGMRSTNASNMYGVYNEFLTANSSSTLMAGVRNRFTNGTPGANGFAGVYTDFALTANGTYYGTRTEYGSGATGTGTKYGSYNYIDSGAGGTHYGVYSDVDNSNGYAGYFLGQNYISQGLGINNLNPDGRLDIIHNSTGYASPHIMLTALNANTGTRITFDNAVETDDYWVMFTRADDTNGSGVFNIFSSEVNTNVLRLESDGKMGIMRNPTTNTLEVEGQASKTTAGAFVANSDRRLKKEIETISGETALSKIEKMRGVTYLWNDDKTGSKRPKELQYGFIAQELMEVFPEKVTKDNLGFYQTAYGDYDPIFVEAIKELKNKNEKLQEKVKNLETQLSKYEALEARLSALENNNSEKDSDEFISEKKK